MRKILYVENLLIGHHVPYITALTSSKNQCSIVITPEHIPEVSCKQYVYPLMDFQSKKMADYRKCIARICAIACREKVDVIHFLDGDKIMRYFGAGMKRLSSCAPVVITYHHFFEGLLRKYSYKRMCRNRYAVVHTDCFYGYLKKYHIAEVSHIEYPSFLAVSCEKEKHEIPVIGMFGDTRYDKGVDILLEALSEVKLPFRLLIAGKEGEFKREQLEDMCRSYREKVHIDLHFLTQEELDRCWSQTDLVVLPYRSIFDGASGQLTEAVRREIPIVGPSHGSLGKIITENHLGTTFMTENVKDLTKKIEMFLNQDFQYDETAKRYRDFLKPERFAAEYSELYSRISKKA